jgi:hypothetical protein
VELEVGFDPETFQIHSPSQSVQSAVKNMFNATISTTEMFIEFKDYISFTDVITGHSQLRNIKPLHFKDDTMTKNGAFGGLYTQVHSHGRGIKVSPARRPCPHLVLNPLPPK